MPFSSSSSQYTFPHPLYLPSPCCPMHANASLFLLPLPSTHCSAYASSSFHTRSAGICVNVLLSKFEASASAEGKCAREEKTKGEGGRLFAVGEEEGPPPMKKKHFSFSRSSSSFSIFLRKKEGREKGIFKQARFYSFLNPILSFFL